MGEIRLTVEHTGEGNVMECRTPQGALIRFDDTDAGTTGSPVQHLITSIGACALYDVNVILRKKRLTFSNLRVECVVQRREEPFPRILTDVRLVFRVDGDVPAQVFEDVVKLSSEKYCSVAGTLTTGVPVHHEAHVGAG